MNDYNSPTETLKRIKNRLEADYFMLNGDVKWLLSEFKKQQKEIEKLKADKQVLSNYKYMYEQSKY
jgi:hypothetical protein